MPGEHWCRLSNNDGKTLRSFSFDECEGGPHELRGVSRANLLSALSGMLPADTIRYASSVKRIDNNREVHLEDGSKITAQVVVGCDGARSVVGKSLGLPPLQYAGYSTYRGVANYQHNLGPTTELLLGRGVRVGLYPLSPEHVYWGGTLAENKRHAAALISDWTTRPDNPIADQARETVGNTPEDNIIRSRIYDRLTLPFQTRWGNGNVTLAGDAAHPMTPNLGQGGCTALEDAIVLARELATTTLRGHERSITDALRAYEANRIRRVWKVVARSRFVGFVLQMPYEPVCALRDTVMPVFLPISHFLDHTNFDCGKVPERRREVVAK
eukprot:jgi/Chlat1/8559/Chrsp82S07978